jgi:hypothetical protein
VTLVDEIVDLAAQFTQQMLAFAHRHPQRSTSSRLARAPSPPPPVLEKPAVEVLSVVDVDDVVPAARDELVSVQGTGLLFSRVVRLPFGSSV